MILMPGNDGSDALKELAAAFNTDPAHPRIGWLMGPKAWKNPSHLIPYALDNDCFTTGDYWCSQTWCDFIDHAWGCDPRPRWALIPDVVGDREGTLARWKRFSGHVGDDFFPRDVPEDAAVVFVGGSTEWKWRTVAMWCREFPRVHVGRVNTLDRLFLCEDLGAESVDGTGWVRNPGRNQVDVIRRWLTGNRSKPQLEFCGMEATSLA